MRRLIKENSSIILAVVAATGTVTTAYLAARAGYQTAIKLDEVEGRYSQVPEDPKERLKERVKLVWQLYIPAAASGAVTIVCIAGAKRIDSRKTLAAQTALTVGQRAYEQYRERIIEEFGPKKDELIRAKVAEDKINEKPPTGVLIGDGNVLCCELWTMRYFMSDMAALNAAVNEVNAKLLRHDYATLDDLYYVLGLEYTPGSSQAGWTSDKLMEMVFSSVLHNGKPALAFEYNYVKGL